MPTVAQLSVKITADSKDAESGLKKVDDGVKKSSGWKGMLGNAASMFAGFSAANLAGDAVGFLKDQIGDMISSGLEANAVQAQTAAVLKSTNDASGMSAKGIADLATQLMGMTGIDDDVIQSTENMIGTFTNIKGDNFKAATQAALDMATAMKTDPKEAAIELGKALNDPAQGLTALQRVGVTFTQSQKDQIAAMEKAGNTAGAQGVILKELNKEFGGSAEASGKANGGIKIFQAQLDNAKQTVGQAFIPVLASLTQAVLPIVKAFAENLPSAIKSAQQTLANLKPELTIVRDALGFVKDRIGDVVGFIDSHEQAMDIFKASMAGIGVVVAGIVIPAFISWAGAAASAAVATAAAALPIIIVGVAIGGLILAIKALIDHWSDISAFFGGFKDALGNLLGTIGDFVGNALGALGGLKDQALAALGNLVSGAVNLFIDLEIKLPLHIAGMVFDVLTAVGNMVVNLLSALGNMASQAIQKAAQLATDFIGDKGLGGLPAALLTLAGQMLDGLIQGIMQGTANVLATVKNFAGSIVDGIKGALGIHSPSTVFASIGSDSALGYAHGLDSGKGKASASAAGVAKSATDSMKSKSNMDAAYAAGQALAQSLADGTYSVNIQEDLQANINAQQQGTTGGKGGRPHFASGGITGGGLFIGAENGPELLVRPGLYSAPRGSRVYNASDTRDILSGGGHTTVNNYNIYPQQATIDTKELARIQRRRELLAGTY